MKKLVSIVLSVVLAATCAAFTFSANAADGYVALYVKEGECELVDNSETNNMAGGNPAKLMPSHGIGYTSQGDSVMWSDVVLTQKATTVVIKGGYNLKSKPGTNTEFWVYLNKIEGEPIAKIPVYDTETTDSAIAAQIYKTATVNVEPGTYTVFLVGETENSGSFSEVGFVYDGYTFGGNWDSVTAAGAVEEPKVEEPAKEEEPKVEEPAKEEEPKEEEPKEEEPKEEEPKEEEPKEEEPKEEEPKEEEPKEEEPKEEEPKEEEPKEEEPKDEEPADAEAPAEGGFPVVPVVIAVIVVAAIVIAIVASKKKKA